MKYLSKTFCNDMSDYAGGALWCQGEELDGQAVDVEGYGKERCGGCECEMWKGEVR